MLKIAFGGYCATGGSVIRDIFQEFSDISVFPGEFRILREKYGLLDLERSIFEDLSFENIDLAVKDFVWLSSNMAKRSRFLGRHGCSYDFYSKNSYTTLYAKFISEITDYMYPMDWHMYDFKKPHFEYLIHRFLRKFVSSGIGKQYAYMVNVSFDDFTKITQKFIVQFIDSTIPSNKSYKAIALHNAVPPHGAYCTRRSLELLGDSKLIIVERDPRDTFLDYPKDRFLPLKASPLERAEAFVRSYKKIREHQHTIFKNKNIMIINFEDLILRTQESLTLLENFIGFKFGKRKLNTYFFPSESIKNIGKWESLSSHQREAIDFIQEHLCDYLYAINR